MGRIRFSGGVRGGMKGIVCIGMKTELVCFQQREGSNSNNSNSDSNSDSNNDSNVGKRANDELKDGVSVRFIYRTRSLQQKSSNTNGVGRIGKRGLHRNPSRIRDDIVSCREINRRIVRYN